MTDPTGRCYPNRFARTLLEAMASELGSFSTQSLLESAGASATLPDTTLERAFPFEQLSAINRALLETYGDSGGRALAAGVGRVWFREHFARFGAFAAFTDPTFGQLSIHTRAGIGLKVVAEIFTRLSDQETLYQTSPTSHHVIIPDSPFVFPDALAPVCNVLSGLMEAAVEAATGGLVYAVREVECRAAGHEHCLFTVSLKPVLTTPRP